MIAHGPLGLKRAELYAATPGELFDLYEGWRWREREEWQRLAWLAANIMNSSGKLRRAVKPRDLLPREFREDKRVTLEEVTRELEEKEKRFIAARRERVKRKVSDSG